MRNVLLCSLLLLLLAACAPAGVTVTRTVETPTPAGQAVPDYLMPAQASLAQMLGLDAAQITLQAVEAVQWSNSCLGLMQPEDVCLEVITPGFRVIFGTPQGDFVYHTNQTGDKFRAAGPLSNATPAATTTPAVIAPGASGVAGIVTISPTCGGPVRPGQDCTAPYQAVISILNARGDVLTQVASDAQGRFSVPLPAGVYTLRPERPTAGIANAGEVSVTVEAGRVTQVEIEYDSGLR